MISAFDPPYTIHKATTLDKDTLQTALLIKETRDLDFKSMSGVQMLRYPRRLELRFTSPGIE